MQRTLLLILTELLVFFHLCDSACSFPSELDGSWYDSEYNAAITIDRSNLRVSLGWSYTVFTTRATTFTCVESDSTTWLFKSDNTVKAYGVNYYLFKCVLYSKITDYSYKFYLKSDEVEDTSNRRVKFVFNTDYDSGVTTSISQICNPSSGPGTEEFHVLVKSSNVADVRQTFPNALLGIYSYSVDDGSSTLCGTGSVWDDCTNNTIMNLNYTQCSSTIFGSTSGEFYAIHSVTSGSSTYVILINSDSTTSSRFTCLAVSGTSASSNPGSCIKQQSPTSRTSDSSSVLITLTAYVLCPLTTDTTESSNIGIIIAVVIIIIILIAAIIVGYIIYYKRKHKRFPWQNNKTEVKPDGSKVSTSDRVKIQRMRPNYLKSVFINLFPIFFDKENDKEFN